MKPAIRRPASLAAALLAAAFVFFACNDTATSDAPGAVTVKRVGTGQPGWHRFRGPNYDGISTETNWTTNWPGGKPKVLWEAELGLGFSNVSFSGNRLYSMGNRGSRDTVYCLDIRNGKTLWTHSYACPAASHPGPRCTPTVDGDRVYTVSRVGDAFCFNAADGKILWQVNLGRTVGAKPPTWGFAGSPLVLGGKVIYNVGTYGTALDKNTGKLAWQTGRSTSGYASPVPLKIDDTVAVAIFAAKGLAMVEADSGRRMWFYPWKTAYDVSAADPIIRGNTVFISTGYGRGCALLKFDKSSVSKVWENKNMVNHFSTCVLLDNILYGFSGNMGRRGSLNAVDIRTGAMKGSYDKVGVGALMAAGGKLVCVGERGELAICDPAGGQIRELARARVQGPLCWSMPTLAGGRIYIRNSKGRLVCLDVSK